MTSEERSPPVVRPAGVHSATVWCEVCGEETIHRIVHLDPPRGARVTGVARCRVCRTTHTFATVPEAQHSVFVIRSDGDRSVRSSAVVPAAVRLEVGERLPGSDPPAIIHKLDRENGRPARSAEARHVRTVWVTDDVGAVLKVSLVEGRRTRSGRLVLDPDTPVRVGDPVTIEGRRWFVVGVRARGHTWRRPEDVFPAREVERVYTRRTVMPPDGSSDWSRSRGTPISRASSTSRSPRSRSGPGVRT